MTSPFTCITCRVAFRDLEIQRQHYKSDWHRYNLKRKVADLPPITAEKFQEKVIAQKTENGQQKNEHESINCKICRKTFNTKNQYENHILSKKHKENAAGHAIEESNVVEPTHKQVNGNSDIPTTSNTSNEKDTNETNSDDEESSDTYENPVDNNDCLFCNHHSRSLTKNLNHMATAHSFFIADPEYCIDIRGLLEYLGEKIVCGYTCIWCNTTGREFHSADAVRAHMLDKGHCKMLHEGEVLAEYAEYYDYSSSYPDAQDGDADAEVEIPELDDSDYQLVLPSGNIIGHRSLMRYYRQSLDPNRAVAIPKSEKLRKVLSQYRALGWTETQKEVAVKKARDIKYMQRVQAKYSTKLQIKANKLQKHFRPQVNF